MKRLKPLNLEPKALKVFVNSCSRFIFLESTKKNEKMPESFYFCFSDLNDSNSSTSTSFQSNRMIFTFLLRWFPHFSFKRRRPLVVSFASSANITLSSCLPLFYLRPSLSFPIPILSSFLLTFSF